jgi:hypothetical protein
VNITAPLSENLAAAWWTSDEITYPSLFENTSRVTASLMAAQLEEFHLLG